MLLLRSILFNLLFYSNLAVLIIIALPTMLMPRRAMLAFAKLWARSSLWLLRVVSDVRVEIVGTEKLRDGPLLIACKHQSTWETFALLPLLRDPTYIMKRELVWIPFFGWYAWKAGMIPVDRSRGSQALSDLNQAVRRELTNGRQVIIFPEGTRRAPGAEPRYKLGIAHFYAAAGIPCIPVALNSGLFWPRRSILRYPGTIRVEVLDPIEPGLDKEAFVERLERDIEGATARLVADGRRKLVARGVDATEIDPSRRRV